MFEEALKNLISLVETYNQKVDEAIEKTKTLVESAKELKEVTAEAKPKRTRKTKAQKEAEAAQAQEAAPSPVESNAPPAQNTITDDQMREAVQQATISKGAASIMPLLFNYHIQDAAQVPEEKRAAFLAELNALPAMNAMVPPPPVMTPAA